MDQSHERPGIHEHHGHRLRFSCSMRRNPCPVLTERSGGPPLTQPIKSSAVSHGCCAFSDSSAWRARAPIASRTTSDLVRPFCRARRFSRVSVLRSTRTLKGIGPPPVSVGHYCTTNRVPTQLL